MKYREMLDRLDRVVTEKEERVKLVRAITELYQGTPDSHSCGEEYMLETGEDSCSCLKCGEKFIYFDDDD